MNKPLGCKSYGSIPHLLGSRLGAGDHHCHEGQERIATVKLKHKHQRIYIQEKLDGSNVGIALKDDKLLPITRAGYLANTSPYIQHHYFYDWVFQHEEKFRKVLKEGERLCGEWLLKAHGTLYRFDDVDPFVAFDIIKDKERFLFNDFFERVDGYFEIPYTITGRPFSVEEALETISEKGQHGALETIEGAVWRVEDHQKGRVDFLTKYIRPDKIDGKYFVKKNGVEIDIWNQGKCVIDILMDKELK